MFEYFDSKRKQILEGVSSKEKLCVGQEKNYCVHKGSLQLLDWNGGLEWWNGMVESQMIQRPKGHIFLCTRISLAYSFTEVKDIDTCIVASL